MTSQTIALIRFFLLNYRQRKNLFLLMIIVLIGFVIAQFVAELSLINSAESRLAFQIEFYRYCLVLLSTLILIVAVAEDYSTGQFESLLSMPVARWQYIIAQIASVALLNLVIVLVASLSLFIQTDGQFVLVWLMSMWLELMLCSFLALLAILSLEKIPSAMVLFISLYILARSSTVIIEIIEQSVFYSDGAVVNQTILMMFQMITFILPNPNAFMQNDLFYALKTDDVLLFNQCLWVMVYGGFLTAVMLFDFYRKEFVLNRS